MQWLQTIIYTVDLVLGDEGGSIGPVVASVSRLKYRDNAGSEESVRFVQWWGFGKYALDQ